MDDLPPLSDEQAAEPVRRAATRIYGIKDGRRVLIAAVGDVIPPEAGQVEPGAIMAPGEYERHCARQWSSPNGRAVATCEAIRYAGNASPEALDAFHSERQQPDWGRASDAERSRRVRGHIVLHRTFVLAPRTAPRSRRSRPAAPRHRGSRRGAATASRAGPSGDDGPDEPGPGEAGLPADDVDRDAPEGQGA